MSGFAWPDGARAAVSISFDDARASSGRGAEVMSEHGLRGTFFVLMSAVRGRAEDWRRIAAAGHEIGNHTRSHPCSGNFPFSRANALEDWTLERMAAELDGANAEAEAFFGARPRSFAYCCGQTFVGRGEATRSYVPLVAQRFVAGRCFRTEYGNDPRYVDLAQIGAVDADGVDHARLSALADAAARDGHWLVLAGHEIADDGPQALRPRELDAFCRALRARGDCWVAPVGEVAERIRAAREEPAPPGA